jgi:DNA (cytosine-5)-methyltransferase 1
MNNIKVADLFCGVGGLTLGFEKAKFKIEMAIDNWDEALTVYQKNFKHGSLKFDLSDVAATTDLLRSREINAIIGGPPCQDFSHAGKREEGERADLTKSFAEVVRNISPLFFVMENVERTKNSKTYTNARTIYKAAGYGLTEVVLDASLCGAPQKRKRFFCIGIKNDEDNALLKIINDSISSTPMTMRDYFKDQLGTEHYYRHPRNYSRRAIYSLDEPSATIRGVNRPIPPSYCGHPADTASLNFARPLTTLERAQVQTFPKSFKWVGSKTSTEQMIGNAVPVNLAKFLARCISKYLDKQKK